MSYTNANIYILRVNEILTRQDEVEKFSINSSDNNITMTSKTKSLTTYRRNFSYLYSSNKVTTAFDGAPPTI